MSAMSNFLENALLDWLIRGQAIGITGASAAAGTGLSTVYIALYTSAPSDTGPGTEVTGGAYARPSVACSLANFAGTQGAGTTTVSTGNTGQTSNNTVITFPPPSANWGTITHMAICDALTAGNMLLWGALTAPKTVNSGDAAPQFSAGALTFQLDN